MPDLPDVTTQIRAFLLSHPGQYCAACLTEGTGLDAKAVKAAFNPSKDHPYSFMSSWCGHCETTALCVAYVGEVEARTSQQAAIALMAAKH